MPASPPHVESPPTCTACAARAETFRRHTASSLTALLAGLELLSEQLAIPPLDHEAVRFLLAHCRNAARALAAHLTSDGDDAAVAE